MVWCGDWRSAICEVARARKPWCWACRASVSCKAALHHAHVKAMARRRPASLLQRAKPYRCSPTTVRKWALPTQPDVSSTCCAYSTRAPRALRKRPLGRKVRRGAHRALFASNASRMLPDSQPEN